MTSNIATKLRNIIDDRLISIAALEKKAGLKTSTVSNIIYGRTKNPREEVLRAVAKALGCSLEELLHGPEEEDLKLKKASAEDSKKDNIETRELLARSSLDTIFKYMGENKIDISFKQFMEVFNKTYLYSIKKDDGQIADHRFVEWYFEENNIV